MVKLENPLKIINKSIPDNPIYNMKKEEIISNNPLNIVSQNHLVQVQKEPNHNIVVLNPLPKLNLNKKS